MTTLATRWREPHAVELAIALLTGSPHPPVSHQTLLDQFAANGFPPLAFAYEAGVRRADPKGLSVAGVSIEALKRWGVFFMSVTFSGKASTPSKVKASSQARARALGAALAGATLVGAAGAAQAQTHNWSGFYVGANAGMAWGSSDARANSSCPATNGVYCSVDAPFLRERAETVAATGSGKLDDKGLTGGVQAGYNVQTGGLVWGAEVDVNSFKLGASRSATAIYTFNSGNNYTIGSSFDTDWLITARGRLGWSMSNVLVYVTGGLAVTNLTVGNNFRDSINFAPGPGGGGVNSNESSSHSSTKLGWTLGGGAEWAMSRNWSLKAEYLYVDFGSVSSAGTIRAVVSPGAGIPNRTLSNPLGISSDLTAHLARVGVNYKF